MRISQRASDSVYRGSDPFWRGFFEGLLVVSAIIYPVLFFVWAVGWWNP